MSASAAPPAPPRGATELRLAELRQMPYPVYLQTPEWRNRRARAYTAARGICLACGRRAEHIHHRTYERLGAELDTDLAAVCHDCHRDIHLHHVERAGMADLWQATDELIRDRRALFGLPAVTLPRRRDARRAQRPRRPRRSTPPAPNSPGRVEIRTVPCPECGAPAGTLCLAPTGKRRPSNHPGRVNAQRRASTL